MRNYDYLIIGGGMTGDAAVSGIREIDAKGTIGMVSSDSSPPYDRPPLTKGLWKDKPLESVWRHTEKHKVDLFLERTVKAIDAKQKTVVDDRKEIESEARGIPEFSLGDKRLIVAGDTRIDECSFAIAMCVFAKGAADAQVFMLPAASRPSHSGTDGGLKVVSGGEFVFVNVADFG